MQAGGRRSCEGVIFLQSALIVVTSLKSRARVSACRAELLPQNPDDEPASVLLERIQDGAGIPY